jgi:hypothetical protein
VPRLTDGSSPASIFTETKEDALGWFGRIKARLHERFQENNNNTSLKLNIGIFARNFGPWLTNIIKNILSEWSGMSKITIQEKMNGMGQDENKQ